MLENLIKLDQDLFLFLNGLHSEGMDPLMWWISGKTTWWPFYLLLLGFLTWTRKWQMIPLVIFIAFSITVTDQTSVHLFKEIFERLRPCHEPELQGLVHIVNNKCGGQFGFVSSHASNTFGIAMLLSMMVRRKWFWALMFSWAALVSYSRIYLGVHYPADILGGAMLGTLCGWLVFIFFRWSVNNLPSQWKMAFETPKSNKAI